MAGIDYDERAFIIDGRRSLLLSGAIHYWRSTPAMWPDLVRRSRDCGLNCVETYVFWGAHERVRGRHDFSDRLDLRRFIEICADMGMKVVLRIGPYICAEVNFGGFPAWLLDVPGLATRTDNQPFKECVEAWVGHLMDEVGDLQAGRGGPLILAQLENEYGMVQPRYGEAGRRYLEWTAALAPRVGIEVPLVMCEGAAGDALPTINGFDVAPRVPELRAQRPDVPPFWTECWPGWYDTWGRPHRRRDHRELAAAVLRFFAAGGSAINYYMWHGGTNFGREAMYSGTTSYDYDAPLDEVGRVTGKAELLSRLHAELAGATDLLLDYDEFTPMLVAAGAVATAAWTGPGGRAWAMANLGDAPTRHAVDGCEVALEAGEAAFLVDRGNGIAVAFRSHADAPAPSRLTRGWEDVATRLEWQGQAEPVGAAEKDDRLQVAVAPGASMLRYTRDETDYAWYEATLESPGARTAVLQLPEVRDVSHLFVNGQYVGSFPPRLDEDRPTHGSHTYTVSLRPGPNQLQVLAVAMGLAKGDWQFDEPLDEERKGVLGAPRLDGHAVDVPWRLTVGLAGERAGLPAGGGDGWAEPPAGPLRWLRAEFQGTAGRSHALDLRSLGKGIAWVNGRCIGRYWQARPDLSSSDWGDGYVVSDRDGSPPQELYHVPADWVVDGTNVIVVFEELAGDPAAVKVLALS